MPSHRHSWLPALVRMLVVCVAVAAPAAFAAPAVLAVPAGPAASPPAVIQAWSRATAPGASTGVAYFEIVNAGPADTLVSIQTPLAEHVEMHSTTLVDGLMKMRMSGSVDVPARGRLKFEPGGWHAMLVDLKQPLKEAQSLPLTLVFLHAGPISVVARVEGLGATGATASNLPVDYRLTAWPPAARGPDFALVDGAGRRWAMADFRGKLLVVFFGFVHCPDVCPAELFKLALALKQMGPSGDRVQVVFITLDPERDTGKVLKGYVAAFDPRFIGLTGSAAQIDVAAQRFHVVYARVPAGSDYSIDHSTSTFILDATGRLRLVGGMNATAGDFAHDLSALAAEQAPVAE